MQWLSRAPNGENHHGHAGQLRPIVESTVIPFSLSWPEEVHVPSQFDSIRCDVFRYGIGMGRRFLAYSGGGTGLLVRRS